jgi:alkylation response protein AidB-like acyl-CoA dehydrogenase
VKVLKENIIWGLGQGLKLALITLNTGRLTVPAACTAMAKKSLIIARDWCNKRVQWGAPIGKYEAVGTKIAMMLAMTFAMDSVIWLSSGLVDRGGADVRLEAAMAKLFCTEAAWRIADDTVQIRGGRGYETADSLKARGEEPIPAERFLRDCRINLIIEGTSEIMRLFIAREAMDPHLRRIFPIMDPKTPGGQKMALLGRAAAFYHFGSRRYGFRSVVVRAQPK